MFSVSYEQKLSVFLSCKKAKNKYSDGSITYKGPYMSQTPDLENSEFEEENISDTPTSQHPHTTDDMPPIVDTSLQFE